MTNRVFTLEPSPAGPPPAEVLRLRQAGAEAAGSVRPVRARRRVLAHMKRRTREFQAAILRAAASAPDARDRAWITDNLRLIRTAVRDVRDLDASLREHQVVIESLENEWPRAVALARQYLEAVRDEFGEETVVAFLEGYQGAAELRIDELWAVKPALQFALLERLTSAPAACWPVLITSLRQLGETAWKKVFAATSIIERILSQDPLSAYSAMDDDSRDAYRSVIAGLATHSRCTEREIAERAIAFASRARLRSNGTRGAERRVHVGYYLVDRGFPLLRAAVGYRRTLGDHFRDAVLAHATVFYLAGIALITALIVAGLLLTVDSYAAVITGLLLLLIPASQAAVDFMNNLAAFLVPPRALPKLDYTEGIPAECATIVAVPTLLLNEAQVRELVLDLEIRFLANRNPNLYFALLTDSPDSTRQVDERDALVDICRALIENLNRKYREDGSPFFLFHRHRAFNASEGRWMGWERKRGKLLDLNRLLRNGYDSFPVKAGDLSVLPRIRYVITLDSDTQLPRDVAARLVGAISHPLNRAVIDPEARIVVSGYGILQPRIGISTHSASRSRLASIYSGETGFDIYTRAVSDVYQDLFGEGIFTGKGIYEVDALRQVLEHRFPENALLSHDLIEGAYARAALVTDIELIDDYPSHFSAYSRRKHRWVRGDWQVMKWLLARVPDYHRRMIHNPISAISRWKILDNLRRSLLEPAMLTLLLGAWFYLPGRPGYWTAAMLIMLLMPVYANLLFSILRAPRTLRALGPWAIDTADAFLRGMMSSFLSLVFLLHQALLSMDAIVRSIARVFVTKRRLLEWETAAEAESAAQRRATVDMYLEVTPALAAIGAGAVWALRPEAIGAALPVIILWFASRSISDWLNRAPRSAMLDVKHEDTILLRDAAERIWRFFRDWSTAETNWLIPDNVRQDGTAAMRLSPTNLGFLLNARVAAVHLRLLGVKEFIRQTRGTLDRLKDLPKHRGHLLNWYDIRSLAPLEPLFVSTVDSGNLAASLWTLKHAVMSFARDPKLKRDVTLEGAAELARIARDCDALVRDMDFAFLYHPRKKVLSVGYDVKAKRLEPSSYDLLASEARIACFIAIAKGDIPQEAWFHLGRGHALTYGERVLISWTGTMFEYLMPSLWMRHHEGTILDRSMRGVIHVQREYARLKGIPWGISESACSAQPQCDYDYAAFGIPELALKQGGARAAVVSPYSSFLALGVDPAAAVENLRRMLQSGWLGRYGFYEAVDFTRDGGEVICSWMAHHQGMSLLAACNLLFNNPMQRYFHSEPLVMATELLLNERVPRGLLVDAQEPAVYTEVQALAG